MSINAHTVTLTRILQQGNDNVENEDGDSNDAENEDSDSGDADNEDNDSDDAGNKEGDDDASASNAQLAAHYTFHS